MTWKTWPKTDQTSPSKRSIYSLSYLSWKTKIEVQSNFVCLKSVLGRPGELKMSLGYTKIHSRRSSSFLLAKNPHNSSVIISMVKSIPKFVQQISLVSLVVVYGLFQYSPGFFFFVSQNGSWISSHRTLNIKDKDLKVAKITWQL